MHYLTKANGLMRQAKITLPCWEPPIRQSESTSSAGTPHVWPCVPTSKCRLAPVRAPLHSGHIRTGRVQCTHTTPAATLCRRFTVNYCTVHYCTVLYWCTVHYTYVLCTVVSTYKVGCTVHCSHIHCTVNFTLFICTLPVLYCTVLYCTVLYCTQV